MSRTSAPSRSIDTPASTASAHADGVDRGERALLSAAMALAGARYWLTVYPLVCRELRRWRVEASRLADPKLRAIALESLEKRFNLDGAAAFAAAGPLRKRRALVRALVAFQALYNFADTQAEQQAAEPVLRARRLHLSLLAALATPVSPTAPRVPERGSRAEDEERPWGDASAAAWRTGGGEECPYTAALIERCLNSLEQLPSWRVVAPRARTVAARIVAFQSLSLGPLEPLERWAEGLASEGSVMAWWELAAAAGSTLALNALIVAACTPEAGEELLEAVERAYHPAACALHSLLDSVVDETEDAATGQLSLVALYPSRYDASARMAQLARSLPLTFTAMPRTRTHRLLAIAMACSYSAQAPAHPAARAVLDALGPPARTGVAMFRAWRLTTRAAALLPRRRARRERSAFATRLVSDR